MVEIPNLIDLYKLINGWLVLTGCMLCDLLLENCRGAKDVAYNLQATRNFVLETLRHRSDLGPSLRYGM